MRSLLFRMLSSLTALSLLLSLGGTFSVSSAHAFDYAQCGNGMDDDRDGRTDYPRDPECDSLDDNTEAPNEGVFVALSDNRETVSAGDALTYVITLKQQREPVKLVDVSLHVPAQHSVVSISDDGTFLGSGIRWTKVAVFNGNTRRLTVHVVVSPTAPAGQLLIARVLADGSEATDTTMVSGRAIPYVENQLELSISDHRDHAGPGDVLDYVVFVRNPEPNGIVTHVRVKIPTVLRNVDAPGADSIGDEIVWRNVRLGSRDERAFNFRATVDDRAPKSYPIQVTARAGNVVAYDRTVTGGDPYSLFASITDNRDAAGRGDLLTYVIHIDNASGRLDPHANIDASIPQYAEFVSATEGGVRDRENIRWLDMTVAPNGSRDLEFTVRVRSDAPDGTLLRASVMTQGQVSTDVTSVRGDRSGYGYGYGDYYAGPLDVEKSADRWSATAGSTVQYTVTVHNSDGRDIRDVTVSDVFNQSSLTVTDPGAGIVGNGKIRWHIDRLRAGERRTFRYRARISRALRPGDAVLNTARAYTSDVAYVPASSSAVDVGTSPYGNDGYDYPYLPQTGIIEDLLKPLENTRAFLTPMTAAAEGNGLPLAIWLGVIVVGLAGGMTLGKKFMT